MQVHATLEEREIPGLRRAFRGRVIGPAMGQVETAHSVAELHRALDRVLGAEGIADEADSDEADVVDEP